MISLLIKRLENAFGLTYDLFELLDERTLGKYLGDLPSNTIGQQAWCMIGGRESYFIAIQLGKWNGFSCSLNDVNNKSLVLEKLKTTSNVTIRFIKDNKNLGIKHQLIFELFEHEIRHQGQLIRYVYGNKLNFPESWKSFIK